MLVCFDQIHHQLGKFLYDICGMKLNFSSTLAILASFAATRVVAHEDENVEFIKLESKSGSAIVVPRRYLGGDPISSTSLTLDLIESGMLYMPVGFGSEENRISLVLDMMGRDLTLPHHMMLTHKSTSLYLTPYGTWVDLITLDKIKIEHAIDFDGVDDNQAARIGLSLEDEEGPSVFESIVEGKSLDIPIFCVVLERSLTTQRTQGSLVMGAMKLNSKSAMIRYNPIPNDFHGWGLRMNELKVEEHSFDTTGAIAVFDLTTPFTIVPLNLFKKLMDLLRLPYQNNDGVLLSRKIDCSYLSTLPTLQFGIETDEYIWSAERYSLFLRDDGNNCVLAIAGYDAHLKSQPVWVLGSTWLLDRSVVFDKATRHIGISDYDKDPNLEGLVRLGNKDGEPEFFGSQEL